MLFNQSINPVLNVPLKRTAFVTLLPLKMICTRTTKPTLKLLIENHTIGYMGGLNVVDLSIEMNSPEANTFLHAMSSKTRRNILKLVGQFPQLNISTIAKQLGLRQATISYQIHFFEKEYNKVIDLITIKYKAGKHGINKFISKKYDRIILTVNGGT